MHIHLHAHIQTCARTHASTHTRARTHARTHKHTHNTLKLGFFGGGGGGGGGGINYFEGGQTNILSGGINNSGIDYPEDQLLRGIIYIVTPGPRISRIQCPAGQLLGKTRDTCDTSHVCMGHMAVLALKAYSSTQSHSYMYMYIHVGYNVFFLHIIMIS